MIHNRAFQELGINAVYLPFRVPRGDVSPFLQQMDMIPVEGYSVTILHKEQAVKVAKEHGLAVTEIGAANTLIRDEASKAVNTDMVAAMDSLQANLPASEDGRASSLATRTVLILSAGGARAIAHGLKAKAPP